MGTLQYLAHEGCFLVVADGVPLPPFLQPLYQLCVQEEGRMAGVDGLRARHAWREGGVKGRLRQPHVQEERGVAHTDSRGAVDGGGPQGREIHWGEKAEGG